MRCLYRISRTCTLARSAGPLAAAQPHPTRPKRSRQYESRNILLRQSLSVTRCAATISVSFTFPILRTDWRRSAIPAGRELIKKWKPEIIFASAPPYTGLIVASRLARALISLGSQISAISGRTTPITASPLAKADRCGTGMACFAKCRGTSDGFADLGGTTARRHGKPAAVVYNGYAAEDFPSHPQRADTGQSSPSAIWARSILRVSRSFPALLRRRVAARRPDGLA